MLSRPAVLALVLAVVLPAPLPAAEQGERAVLVELFTSQGCSSCPPADRFLRDLAMRPDIVALALHVDYWDYLGWKDTFADPRFTLRQIGYRDALGARAVYTPQIVVHGAADAVGSRRAEAEALIAAARAAGPAAEIAIRGPTARLAPAGAPGGGGRVWAALYDRHEEVEIGRGENAGRVLSYSNVVRRLEAIGRWDGAAPAEFPLPEAGPGQGVAVWLQDGENGRVLAAAKHEP